MPNDDRDPLDVLAEEFADRLRRGEHPSVTDYAARHPQHADELRELLPAVAQMEMLKRFRGPAVAVATGTPDRLGDFRIVRELGRGGMGVVFEAVQESLGRSVALKVLARHAQLDPGRRERFVREAQAAARLHHTNIVSVFGVGEHDGLPYYAMQLIPGCGLHAVVGGWRREAGLRAEGIEPTLGGEADTDPAAPGAGAAPPAGAPAGPAYGDWRFVADVGVQAALALHYAHKQGVLHRDVKPANLIFDGEAVWVADFGLAKLANTDGLTASGDILGTLQYLPPESLSGEADARGDVYGLGATLYELLTLDPPYRSDSPARLIKQVGETDPPPPRAVNPAIPRDLETIVLKAMAREPRARYATARELADDLQAFLDDRPIRARRTTALYRGWRWCRRNPSVAALAASTLLAVSLAAVLGWVGYAQTTKALTGEAARRREADGEKVAAQREKDAADDARAAAQRAAAKLEANLDLSLKAFEKVFEAVSGTGRQGFGLPPLLAGDGHVIGPRETFGKGGFGPGGHGKDGRDGFGPDKDGFGPKKGGFGPDKGFGPERDGFGPKRDGGKDAPKDVGPGAETATVQAAVLATVLEFYGQFAQQRPPSERGQFEAARALRRMCEAYTRLKKPAEARDAFRRAEDALLTLHAQNAKLPGVRGELVMLYLAAPPDAVPGGRDELMRRAAEYAAGNRWLTGTVRLCEGWLHDLAGNHPAAEASYRDAIAATTAAARFDDPPAPPNAHLERAFVRLRLAYLLHERNDNAGARSQLEASVAELTPLAVEGESGWVEREWARVTHMALGGVCRQLGDHVAARRATEAAQRLGPPPFGGPPDDHGPAGKKEPPPKK